MADFQHDLAVADRHVAEAERHIRRQRQIVARLARDGHDTTMAESLLDTLEAVHESAVEHRDLIRRQLAAEGRSPGQG